MLLDGTDPAAIARAAEAIAAGELVAFPTETVYGLGARADVDDAVAKIFALKGRPQEHPLIVHVADRARAERFAAALPPVAERLIDAFWPGPLTVIVLRAAGIADAAAARQATIGLRCPAHPIARAARARSDAPDSAGRSSPGAPPRRRRCPRRAAR